MTPSVLHRAADLRGGGWFRLHPLTPVLRGGVALLGLVGAALAVFWQTLIVRAIPFVVGVDEDSELGDVALFLADTGVVVVAGVVAVVVIAGVVFWLQWRVHLVRMDDDVVELGKGIIAKTSRRVRRDRINTIGVRRPLVARLLGLATLDIQAAGSDANVVLAYLPYRVAHDVRQEILHRSDTSTDATKNPTSVTEVEVPLFRYVASLVVSLETIFFAVAALATVFAAVSAQQIITWLLPLAVAGGYVAYVAGRFFRVGNFVVDSVQGNLRVSLGLLSTSVETIPTERIHALQISQPWPWKILGWWRVEANLASSPGSQNSKTPAHTLLLPVATTPEMLRMVELAIPQLANKGHMDDIITLLTQRTARWAQSGIPEESSVAAAPWALYRIPFSARVTGSVLLSQVVALRSGWWILKLSLVPLVRIHSTSVSRGPWHRVLGLSRFAVESVEGPVSTEVLGLHHSDATAWWSSVGELIVAANTTKGPGQPHARRAV